MYDNCFILVSWDLNFYSQNAHCNSHIKAIDQDMVVNNQMHASCEYIYNKQSIVVVVSST